MSCYILINLILLTLSGVCFWRASTTLPQEMLTQNCTLTTNTAVYEVDPYVGFKAMRWITAVLYLKFVIYPYHRFNEADIHRTFFWMGASVCLGYTIGFGISVDMLVNHDCQNPSTLPIVLVMRDLTFDFIVQLIPVTLFALFTIFVLALFWMHFWGCFDSKSTTISSEV